MAIASHPQVLILHRHNSSLRSFVCLRVQSPPERAVEQVRVMAVRVRSDDQRRLRFCGVIAAIFAQCGQPCIVAASS